MGWNLSFCIYSQPMKNSKLSPSPNIAFIIVFNNELSLTHHFRFVITQS